jgi:dipeptidyl aminopeptidase/acylaminoacyl peptidase
MLLFDQKFQNKTTEIMKNLMVILFVLSAFTSTAQMSEGKDEESMITKILMDPSPQEISEILSGLRKQDLTPGEVVVHDSIELSNSNKLYVLSHKVEGLTHYGAVIIPPHPKGTKLPVLVFATGGDGMHKEFDISQDFNHAAVQFPGLLGGELDKRFVVVIPSFRGQQLVIGDRKYQSDGNVSDAFDGATTDALAFLNVTIKTFHNADESRIAIYGGSRGGTVALLASSRDKRIKRTIVVAAPTDMKALYQLYPDQFKLLFFNDLLSGKITESDARRKFISISPIYFTNELPLVQLHHDKKDPFVPATFARSLSDKMKMNGKTIDTYEYNEGIHGFWTDKNFWKRVQEFIIPLTE